MKKTNIVIIMIAACSMSVPLYGETIGQIYARGRREMQAIGARTREGIRSLRDEVIASGHQIPPPPRMTFDMFPDFVGGLAKKSGASGMSVQQRQMPSQNGQMACQGGQQWQGFNQEQMAIREQSRVCITAHRDWFDNYGATTLKENPNEFLSHIQSLQQIYTMLVTSRLVVAEDNPIAFLTYIVNLQNMYIGSIR